MLNVLESVSRSAGRCGGMTLRLLGSVKRMQVQIAAIDLDLLLRDVVGFLEKEAAAARLEGMLYGEG